VRRDEQKGLQIRCNRRREGSRFEVRATAGDHFAWVRTRLSLEPRGGEYSFGEGGGDDRLAGFEQLVENTRQILLDLQRGKQIDRLRLDNCGGFDVLYPATFSRAPGASRGLSAGAGLLRRSRYTGDFCSAQTKAAARESRRLATELGALAAPYQPQAGETDAEQSERGRLEDGRDG
jgi:hypothetical protein